MAAEPATSTNATGDDRKGVKTDVTERTRQLKELSERDALTGLYNRRTLFDMLKTALQRATVGGHQVGVFFFDVDNFKSINDSMGNGFGDRVLIGFAERLAEVTGGLGFAARLGGDEFTVVYERATSVEDIRTAGLAVIQAFKTDPYR